MEGDATMYFLGILIMFFLLMMTITSLMAFSGVFESVIVKTGAPPIGKVTIAYKFARGSYQEVGPWFFEVAKIAPDNRAIGVYYDDPSKVEVRRRRYIVASILAEDEQEADERLVKKFEAEGFKITVLPEVAYAVHTSFPYQSYFSVFIGARKVYPRMTEYINEHGLKPHPVMEIYAGSTIYYMAPLEQQDKFYVPETQQQYPGEEPYEIPPTDDLFLDTTEDDSSATETDQERPETGSLLHPSQIMHAEVIGKVEEQLKQEEQVDEKAEEAVGKEGSPEPSPVLTGEAEKEEGSESGSSFEDLKLEAEEVSGEPVSQ